MRMNDLRIGHGFDIHRFAEGRPLRIGGVTIPFRLGLEGHSDADVLVHAICDALLGSAGLADIGQQFPPSDQAYAGIDSLLLLDKVRELALTQKGRILVNLDAVILAEEPKLNPHIAAMKQQLAARLGVAVDRIGIKATTCESLGAIGRHEGIAASAVCLVVSNE